MSNISSMTSKGQVTIPKEVRDELGLKPFDKIQIVADGRGGALLHRVAVPLESVAGMFPGLDVSEEALDHMTSAAIGDYYEQRARKQSKLSS